MKKCKHCNELLKDTDRAGKVSHVLHFLISMFTLSFWIIVWCFLSMKTSYVCSNCKKATKYTNLFPLIIVILFILLLVLVFNVLIS